MYIQLTYVHIIRYHLVHYYCCIVPSKQLPGVGNAIIAAALFNSAYSFAWDVKMDWGLGQTGSRTWGLRNTLLISHEEPWPYYLAVVADLVLRLSWLLRLKEGRFGHVDMVLTLELVEVGIHTAVAYSVCIWYQVWVLVVLRSMYLSPTRSIIYQGGVLFTT